MTFRIYLMFMAVATALATFAWGVIVWNTDPFETGITGLLMFYLTLFMTLVGALTILGSLYRVHILKRKDVLIREVKISFRHAIALAMAGIAALVLSAQGKLHWWSFLILIVTFSIVEYLFLVKEESRRS